MKLNDIKTAIEQKLHQTSQIQIAYWLGELATDNLELFSQLLSCALKYKESSVKQDLLQMLPMDIICKGIGKGYIETNLLSLADLKPALPYLQTMDAASAQSISALLYFLGHSDKQGVEAKKAACRHLKACTEHEGFSQLSTRVSQAVLNLANEVIHSSRELSSDEAGCTNSRQLLASYASNQPSPAVQCPSEGLAVANPVIKQKRQDEPEGAYPEVKKQAVLKILGLSPF